VEPLEDRTVPYAVSANAWANPELITISFVPDGTVLGSNGSSTITSNLFSSFSRFGSAAAWQKEILRAAQSWAQQTDLNFTVVADNGAALGSGNYQQGDPNMGDVRIGGYNFGSNALAQTYLPPPVNNYSVAGDVQFNTAQAFNVGSTYDLYTVASHEFGHALGLYHSGVVSAAMYSGYTGVKSGLTGDDVAGIRSIYSGGAGRTPDADDQAASNGTAATASDVTGQLNAVTGTALITGLDVTTTSDVDFYRVDLPLTAVNGLTVKAQSQGLSLLAPKLTVYASDGCTVLGTATVSGYAGGVATVNVPGLVAGQRFYVKVQGADSSPFGTGAYALSLDFGLNAAPVAASPSAAVAAAQSRQSGGGQAVRFENEALTNSTTVNVQQTRSQAAQSAAVDGQGNYVVAWASNGQDGNGWGVFARRYQADGTPLGGEFQVNTTTQGDQLDPAVAMNPSGGFVIAWTSNGQDGAGGGVYGQRFAADGTRLGGEFRVNTTTKGDQGSASAAMDGAGGFVVTWQSNGQDGSGWGVYAQRYDAGGARLGGEFLVPSNTAGDQTGSRVDTTPGGFVVTWQSKGEDGSGWGVYARLFDASGTPVGAAFRVNTTTLGDQDSSAVAADGSGNFVVVWASNGQDGDGDGIFGQRFAADGTRLGGEFQVNTTTRDNQTTPTVVMDSAGNFVVGWASNNQDGNGWGVYAQQFDPAGIQVGTEFRLSTTTAGNQINPSLGLGDGGHLVAVWSGRGNGDDAGVFQQRFLINGSASLLPADGLHALTPDGSGEEGGLDAAVVALQGPQSRTGPDRPGASAGLLAAAGDGALGPALPALDAPSGGPTAVLTASAVPGDAADSPSISGPLVIGGPRLSGGLPAWFVSPARQSMAETPPLFVAAPNGPTGEAAGVLIVCQTAETPAVEFETEHRFASGDAAGLPQVDAGASWAGLADAADFVFFTG
jgi:predicted Zn-dependent protease